MTFSLKSLHLWISDFTCSMIRMQGFRPVKVSLIENTRWPSVLKKAKPLKSTFSPEWLGIFGWNFVCRIFGTLVLSDIRMKKICCGIRSQWPFENLHQPLQNLRWPWLLSPFKWLSLWNHCAHGSQISHALGQTLGLQNDKIQGVRESKMATNAKNSKTNKINFFSRMAWYIWQIFCMKH